MILRNKILVGFATGTIVLAMVLFALSNLLVTRVNTFVINLTERMSKEIGHPVLIDRVVTKWDWMLLKINIKNLKILEKDGTFPLFMANEIISTVDTIASIRSFSLKFKHLLIRSPRLVIQWDEKAMPTVLGLGHQDVNGTVDPASLFKILGMQRRIIVENGDLHLQGKNGADLPFMDISLDFKQHREQEYTMTARGNIAAAVQPEFVIAVKYLGELAHYDKAMLEFEIKTSNVQLAELFNFVPKYRQNIVRGNFTDFDLKGVVQNGTVRSISSDFSINYISIDQDTHIKGGVGHIEYRPGDNKTALQLAHLTLHNDKLYSQPLTVDAINTDLLYTEQPDGQVQVNAKHARVKLMEMEFRPEFTVNILDNKISKLSFVTNFEDATVRRSLVLVPDRKFPGPLTEWLKKSIIDGEIEHVKINYDEQKLLWSLAFKNAEVRFASDWPSVYGIDATLVMDNGKLSIDASKAMILGNSLRTLTTSYNEINGKPYTLITIDGSMDTTLEEALKYIQQTPLQDKFGSKLEAFNPSGKIDLSLQLDINLSRPEIAIGVNGTVDLKSAKLQTIDINIPIENINGVLAFTNNSFTSDNLYLTLLGQPATATVAMHASKGNTLNISLSAPLKIASLKTILPGMNFDYLSGTTNVTANLELPWEHTQSKTLMIRSDLVGVEINYPAPFNKSAKTKMPLNVQYCMHAKREDTLKFKLGLLDGILFLKDRKLHGGRVQIGKKLETFSETESLHIGGNIKKLSWADWSPLMQSKQQSEWLPIELDLLVDSFLVHEDQFNPIHIKYNSAISELFLDSQIVTGSIIFNQEAEIIEVKLDKLNVPQKRVKNNAMLDYLRDKRTANTLPLIQFNCDKLYFDKHLFRKISLELLPRTYGYEIMNFSINNENLLLQAQGSWQMDADPITTLAGSIYTQNFGKVLAEWGYVNSISRGKGELNFTVQWDGSPIDFDVLKIKGNSHLDLRSGSLTNVNPGIGRIISLLSLETIQRRLQLDFSDILSRGFAFDKFIADIKLEPGSVMSDNILITSPAAKIELFGKTGIKSQDLDFTMFVTPKVGAGLPIAAAIAAGNPAIGAAIWLFDKAAGSKISEIAKYRYKVTGTWDKPQIDEVTGRSDNVKVAG